MSQKRYTSLKSILLLKAFLFVTIGFASATIPESLDGDPEGPQNLTRLKIVGGVAADETIVYFDSRATDGYDEVFDAVKMLAGVAGVPNIYSRMDSTDLSINVMGTFNADKVIPLILNITKNGAYTISVLELINLDPTTMVYLEDRSQNKFYNLRLQTSLTFNFTISLIQNRFFLHYKVPVQFSTTSETCRQNDGVIQFNNPSDHPWNVKLLTADGLTELATADSVVGEHAFIGLDGGDYNLSIVKPADGYSHLIPATVTGALALDPEFNAPADPVMTGAPVQFSANQTGTGITYNWDLGDGTILTGTSVVDHIYNAPGVYTITLLISDGTCSDASQFSLVVLPDVVTAISVPAAQKPETFEAFPNPVKDILTIKISENLKEEIEWVQITDLQGRIVRNEYVSGLLFSDQNLSFPVEHLASGTYYIRLLGKSEMAVKPFIIKH